MQVLDVNIPIRVSVFFEDCLKMINSFELANQIIYDAFRVLNFFDDDVELNAVKKQVSSIQSASHERDRAEYGDFQTNLNLANNICLHLASKNITPEIVIEPTCGEGNFIIAALKTFKCIKKIIGVEIYKPYTWETKFKIIDFLLQNPQNNKPDILIAHNNVFDFDFKLIAKKNADKDFLIIGNPPWVTNSKLSSLSSSNVPKKTNFKNHNGLDAITGKGNFDIAEFIALKLLDAFQFLKGHLLLIVKNSVIKNLVFDQVKNKYKISSIEKYCINSKKEFNVSVEASLFYCKLNSFPSFECREFNFYLEDNIPVRFGWVENKFVSNIDTYVHTMEIDGDCPFIWRQGLKHDCSSVMELDKINGHYINGVKEEIKLEEDLVYGFLKSSDLKNTVINQTRKFTIVTQKRVGQDTKYIKSDYPQTYKYLIEHKSDFESRKSIIYKNKPLFSIFGIGDYSFELYKIAISGLYKTFHFTLVLPQNGKPVMLDDTCYLIGFEKIEFAIYTLILLNSEKSTSFLQSITFADAKRTFTKDVLMRIDILTLAKSVNKQDLVNELTKLNKIYNLNLTLNLWENFIYAMAPVVTKQISMSL